MQTGTLHAGEHVPSEDTCWLWAPSGGQLLNIHA
jgi:hypothetical protein